MKLEVGQKIGIYEIINNDSGRKAEYPTGFQSIGEYDFSSCEFKIFKRFCFPDNFLWYAPNEVRKVGSLIVKRLK